MSSAISVWPEFRDRLRRDLTVVRDEGDRLLVDCGAQYVRVKRASMDGVPAVELALVVAPMTRLDGAALAAANDNLFIGKVEVAKGSLLLQHTVPLESLSIPKLKSLMAFLVIESGRLGASLRPPREIVRLFAHLSD